MGTSQVQWSRSPQVTSWWDRQEAAARTAHGPRRSEMRISSRVLATLLLANSCDAFVAHGSQRFTGSRSFSSLPARSSTGFGGSTCAVSATMAATDNEDGAVKAAFTTAGLLANPIAIVSLAKLQLTGCPLPPGPGGLIRLCETLSYLVVAGVVFSWTPEAGAFGSAGLNLDQSAQDKPVATQEDDEVGTSTVATQQKTQLGNLTAVVEVASWIVFVVGFILFVQNIVSPGGVLCVDGVAGAGGSALEPADLLSLDAADMAADLR